MQNSTIVAAVPVAFSAALWAMNISPVDTEEGRDGYERAKEPEEKYPRNPTVVGGCAHRINVILSFFGTIQDCWYPFGRNLKDEILNRRI